MYQIEIKKHVLKFNLPAGTSRGIMYEKPSWFILLRDVKNPETVGLGECGLLPGLSIDDHPEYENTLAGISKWMENEEITQILQQQLKDWPSIRFGLEMAWIDLQTGGKKILFPGEFTRGRQSIPINGLIWMGDQKNMLNQIEKKISEGWHCLKLKVGAIDFKEELFLLKYIRNAFSPAELELRLDANGGFTTETALDKIKHLAEFGIHSIEQPIMPDMWDEMAELCIHSPIDIALDEELILHKDLKNRETMLKHMRPAYIIIKPSLIGGFESAGSWINIASDLDIAYWITSALESNIGLNAISQWTSTLQNPLPQGLGTGLLYSNNFESPLVVKPGFLSHDPSKIWDTKSLTTTNSNE